MDKQLDIKQSGFVTPVEQIEIIDDVCDNTELLKMRSLNAFTKRYFEKEMCEYTQTISANDGSVHCKVYLNGKQISEASASTFNHARTTAAILALQDRNFELLKTWMGIHREDLQAYLNV